MYMLSYKGAKSNRTFGVNDTVEECQLDAALHAIENPRLRGEYLISKVEVLGLNKLVCADLAERPLVGIKRGKSVEWIL